MTAPLDTNQPTNRQWEIYKKVPYNAKNQLSSDYKRGYKSGYAAGKKNPATINQKINQEFEELLAEIGEVENSNDVKGANAKQRCLGRNQMRAEVCSIIKAKINGGEKDEGSTKS